MKRYLKLLAAILIFVVLFIFIDFQELVAVLGNITLELAIYLIFLSFVLIYISSIKWGIFLASVGIVIPLIRLYKFYLFTYFVNLILPSFIGGDLSRSILVTDKESRSKSLAATFMERLSGLIAMLFLSFLALPWIPNIQDKISYPLILIGLLLTLLLFLTFKINLSLFFSKWNFFDKLAPKIATFQEAVQLMFKNPRLLLGTLLLSLVFHSITVVNTLAAAWAVGWWDAPILDFFVVLPIILLISAIPITPSGLGIQEGAFFYFLTLLGAAPEQALGVALVLRGKSYIIAIIGSLVFFKLKSPNQN